jgi:toxin-antitoxin system PIN domain toxin
VILVDANILLYAEDSLSEHHEKARKWWDRQLSGSDRVGLCWPVLIAFVRIGTNPRLHRRPLLPREAVARIQSWFEQPCVRVLRPGERHWELFQQMLAIGNASANLVSDAHRAALALEHNSSLASTDTDFARFRGLKWINPLAS